jgi:hypothetical protein
MNQSTNRLLSFHDWYQMFLIHEIYTVRQDIPQVQTASVGGGKQFGLFCLGATCITQPGTCQL